MHVQDLYEYALAMGNISCLFTLQTGIPRSDIPMSPTMLQSLPVAGSLLTVEQLGGDAASVLDMFGIVLEVSNNLYLLWALHVHPVSVFMKYDGCSLLSLRKYPFLLGPVAHVLLKRPLKSGLSYYLKVTLQGGLKAYPNDLPRLPMVTNQLLVPP